MEPLSLAEIVSATGGRLARGEEQTVTGISIDSRTLEPGDLYVAIRGKRLDGHDFVAQATERGAMGAVVEREQAAPERGAVIVVENTTLALGRIAAYYRGRLKARVVAVTGSNGKTTTKEMLAAILAGRFRTLKPENSFNNDIGVPLTVLRMDRATEAAVFEIEMNELGGTERLALICRPEVGIVTNIGDTHLEFMKDRNGVAREKAELLQSLPADGTAVLNADDPLVVEIGQKHARVSKLFFGLGRGADVYGSDVKESGLETVEFRLQGKLAVRLPVPGVHNVSNCLAACAAARALGIGFEEMPSALAGFTPLAMRLRLLKLSGVTLIDDCYNANPQSVRAALELLRRNAEPGHRVALLGDMLELGDESADRHRSLGGELAGTVDRLVLVGPMGEHTRLGAIESGMDPDNTYRFVASDSVGEALFDIIKSGDTILVKGSRAIAMERLSQEIARHYGKDSTQQAG